MRGYQAGPGQQLQHRTNGHNTAASMDVIDTSLRVGMASGSREKLHPKQGFDEEQVSET